MDDELDDLMYEDQSEDGGAYDEDEDGDNAGDGDEGVSDMNVEHPSGKANNKKKHSKGDDDEEEEELDPQTLMENEYYTAKAHWDDSEWAEARASLENVLAMEAKLPVRRGTTTTEPNRTEMGFKAVKKLVKFHIKQGAIPLRAGETRDSLIRDRFALFMAYCKTAVTANSAEKGLNSILDALTAASDKGAQPASASGGSARLLEEIYGLATAALLVQKNERAWFRTMLRFGKVLYDTNQHAKLEGVLASLHKSCRLDNGEDDPKKGSQLVDIYALEIQMYTATKNNKRLKELYHKALSIRSAIPHPRIMGVIRECGGKMHMRAKSWEKAHTDFFEAFKNYDEAGSPRRIQCLMYLVLANMLSLSNINPFEATETKPYKNDPEILALCNLQAAYERKDVKSFEQILKQNQRSILEDPFMKDYINDLLVNIRGATLERILLPYTQVRLGYIAQELNVPPAEVEALIVSLIMDGRLRGRLDQVHQVLHLQSAHNSSTLGKYHGMDGWTSKVNQLHGSFLDKVAVI